MNYFSHQLFLYPFSRSNLFWIFYNHDFFPYQLSLSLYSFLIPNCFEYFFNNDFFPISTLFLYPFSHSELFWIFLVPLFFNRPAFFPAPWPWGTTTACPAPTWIWQSSWPTRATWHLPDLQPSLRQRSPTSTLSLAQARTFIASPMTHTICSGQKQSKVSGTCMSSRAIERTRTGDGRYSRWWAKKCL